MLGALVVFAAGWAAGAATGDRWHPRPMAAPGRTVFDDFRRIAGHNFGVMLQIVSGASTLCVLSAVMLAWNVFSLGMNLRGLAGGCAQALRPVLWYVPMEFGALILATAASGSLMVAGARWLLTDARSVVRAEWLALVAAASLIIVAAAVEVLVWRAQPISSGCGFR